MAGHAAETIVDIKNPPAGVHNQESVQGPLQDCLVLPCGPLMPGDVAGNGQDGGLAMEPEQVGVDLNRNPMAVFGDMFRFKEGCFSGNTRSATPALV